ncbi:chloride channel [Xanthomonas citri pv. citri]|nr:chloride channel [Xanthomonas axonopodis Xac29-1]AJD70365.1 hypothetical protein J151_03959 [Xanthomonas citri subsp. citri A306]AJY83874.1 hypothetical protein J159_03931 [Xanthomonas citri pv. citri]AJY88300.1 hypothetical protein J158_03935 [Xanthomonas citri subsp. citri UI6]AOL20926.1 chloride channel [Xanthomonas citri pv. malvacearum]EKQ60162.1 chloride channel [Xanthomonas citri pv. malvacearum str. GSPB2388]EKQ66254.1 chloride channel [Xanthomonas citri pv. malvacearum str. GSPB13
MKVFDTPQADELAVIDSDGKVLSVLWEGLVRKRYAEELKKRGRELMGERAVSDDLAARCQQWLRTRVRIVDRCLMFDADTQARPRVVRAGLSASVSPLVKNDLLEHMTPP